MAGGELRANCGIARAKTGLGGRERQPWLVGGPVTAYNGKPDFDKKEREIRI